MSAVVCMLRKDVRKGEKDDEKVGNFGRTARMALFTRTFSGEGTLLHVVINIDLEAGTFERVEESAQTRLTGTFPPMSIFKTVASAER